MIATAPSFALFGLGEAEKIVADLGLATILLCGVFTAVTTVWATVIVEREDQTAMAIMAKPVMPHTYILAKYLGLGATLAMQTAALALVLLLTLVVGAAETKAVAWAVMGLVTGAAGALALTLRLRRGGPSGEACVAWAIALAWAMVAALAAVGWPPVRWRWDVAAAGGLELLELGVVGAIVLALALRLQLVTVGVLTAGVMLVGNMAGAIAQVTAQVAGGWAGTVVRTVLPNLENFHVAEAVALGAGVPASVAGWAAVYAALYVTGVLGIAVAVYGGREAA